LPKIRRQTLLQSLSQSCSGGQEQSYPDLHDAGYLLPSLPARHRACGYRPRLMKEGNVDISTEANEFRRRVDRYLRSAVVHSDSRVPTLRHLSECADNRVFKVLKSIPMTRSQLFLQLFGLFGLVGLAGLMQERYQRRA